MAVDITVHQTGLITGEELARLGNLGRCELIDGRIVPMSPTGYEHGEIENAIGTELRTFARSQHLGKVLVGEVGIYTRRDPDRVRGVDVLFISNERYAQKKSNSYLDVAPELVVEILSPNDSWGEVMQKLREYFAIGVRLVWVADPAERRVYAYRALNDMREFNADNELPGDDVLPGFAIPVARLFEA